MTALSKARNFKQTNPDYLDSVGLDTNVIVYNGAMMAKADDASGYAHPATAATGEIVLGIADLTESTNNPASGQAPVTPDVSHSLIDMTSVTAGTVTCQIRRGTFERENKSGDLVTNQHIGLDVYVEDDNTVRATGAGTIVAGTLMGFHPRSGKPMVQLGVGGRGI
jgi:hypothetical protein